MNRTIPAFPAQWFTAYFVLPGDRALLPPSLSRSLLLESLNASVGASGPHDFAVREIRRSSIALPASTASRRNVS